MYESPWKSKSNELLANSIEGHKLYHFIASNPGEVRYWLTQVGIIRETIIRTANIFKHSNIVYENQHMPLCDQSDSRSVYEKLCTTDLIAVFVSFCFFFTI